MILPSMPVMMSSSVSKKNSRKKADTPVIETNEDVEGLKEETEV